MPMLLWRLVSAARVRRCAGSANPSFSRSRRQLTADGLPRALIRDTRGSALVGWIFAAAMAASIVIAADAVLLPPLAALAKAWAWPLRLIAP